MLLTIPTSSASQIRVMITFPEKWNWRFLALGNKGAAGTIFEEELSCYSKQGYVTAMTDLGTAPNPRLVGIHNPEVWKDYGYRATELMTHVVKEEIRKRYHSSPIASYFVGVSTGGQQAFSVVQRLPSEYNGVIAGVPAHSRTRLHAYFLWVIQHLYDANGKYILTKSQEQSYHRAALEYFAAGETLEIARGRFISNPNWSQRDQEAVLEAAVRLDPSIGERELGVLRALQQGPVHAVTGRSIFGGVPPAAPLRISMANLFPFTWVFGEGKDLFSLNFHSDIDRYISELAPLLDADDPDILPFDACGGKMIIYSGSQDSSVPYHATRDYYLNVVSRVGSIERTQSFCRYYLLPGRNHIGGPGVQEIINPLRAIRNWYEKGQPPSLVGYSNVLKKSVDLTQI